MMPSATGTCAGTRGRLRLARRSSVAAVVDGVWWPRCRELGEELPLIVPVLGTRLRSLARVQYSSLDWRPAGPELHLCGAITDLDGSRDNPHGYISFIGPDSTVVFGLVAPEVPASTAEQQMTSLLLLRRRLD
ncbi:DUF5994 family protein [Tsukamurella soli]|uniref:Uncharacterized protein n=1 Tax=Tsukamurella soli TaxID=644556 RepID=A0ABP8JR23_9ACTN